MYGLISRAWRALLTLTIAVALAGAVGSFVGPSPAMAQDQTDEMQLVPPAGGQNNNIEMWRAVRGGVQGTVSIPDKKAGVLVQSEGEDWRSMRNGPLSTYGVWLMLGTIAVLALFFAYRGRIRIEAGRSGKTIVRFAAFERLVHWVMAVTFILLALSGLNMLYGRYVLLPALGPESFAALTMAGKLAHNYLGFLFIASLVVTFLMWIRHNVPSGADITWLAKGGGILGKNHPAAPKFNAGQKLVFLAVIVIGAVISYTGLSLVYPFEFDITVQAMQGAQLLHSIAALVLIALIIAHIYIGTIGMEGAIESMWTGTVDENWAREHHSLWVEELEKQEKEAPGGADTAPAE
jgi:formate dehydrogenase subunit gamma